MIDAKSEVSLSQSAESGKGHAALNYNSIRILASLAVENWLQKHDQGRNDGKLLAIIDNPDETPERQGEATDIRYLRLMVRNVISQQQEEAFPSDKLFPITELDDETLTWLLVNSPERPSKELLQQEAQKREFKISLDDAISAGVPRDLIKKLAYKVPERRLKVK